MSWLHDYWFAHEGMFVIPAEHLSEDGSSATYKEALAQRATLRDGWIELFDAAAGAYWQRAAELAQRAPMYWFPPRAQHVCVVTDPERVRPYFQPFHKSAWLLYATDFDPLESNVEFAVFQLLQAERIGLMQALAPALGCNLSYWLTRGDEEVESFAAACKSSTRPDAEAYVALADALPWIRELHHEILRPPVLATPGRVVTIQGTGLMIPAARQPDVDRLVQTWTRVTASVAAAHYAAHAGRTRNHAEDVCGWLRDEAPRVIVTGAEGRILWDPAQPRELGAVRQALAGVTASAAESLEQDLALIGRHSQAFVDALRHPEQLPAPNPAAADQNGLSYMHLTRREIAYNLREERMQRLREPAPPYERFMLGARTVHEWGHLATEAGWVPVPETRRAEYEEAIGEAGALFDRIVAAAPASVRGLCSGELARLSRGEPTPGPALVRLALSRVEDFQSNLLSQRFLSPQERETYIRNNIRSLVHDYSREGFFHRLARYAYEYQYLRFSALEEPRDFFSRVTWIEEQYLRQGILSETDFDDLLEGLGRICDTYEVDEREFV